MINYKALSKISYGLYVVCSGDKNRGSGFICNSVVQVTSNPVQLMVCCNKKNYTAKEIARCGVLSISVLPQTVSPEIIGIFGYKSGQDTDKFKDFEVRYGTENMPVLVTEAIATMECKVKQTVDAGTHLLYVCEVAEAALLNNLEPMTYDYYHKVKKGLSPKNAPTYMEEPKKQVSDTVLEKHRCLVCGYIYEDAEHETPFSALDDDWVCPVCGASKSEFEKI